MRNNSKRGVKHRAQQARRHSEPCLDTEARETAIFATPSSVVPLQSVLDSLTYPFYVIDVADYRVRLANRAAREAYRTGAATCYALTHRRSAPCHTEDHPCPIEIIKGTGKPTVVEHIHYEEDGTPRNVEVHAFPIFDEAGTLAQIIEYAVDITERKQAEEALRAAKAISESMIESLPGTFYLFDSSGRLLKWNRNLEQVSGYTAEEIARRHPLDFFEGQDKQLIEQKIQEVFTQGRSSVEAQLVAKDGHKTPYFFTGMAITLGAARCVIGTGIDISERKQAEELLRQSERQFRGTFENVPLGIAHIALDGRILRFNDRFCAIAGCSCRDVLCATCEEITLATDWRTEQPQMQRLLDGGLDHYSIEKRCVRMDGHPIWVNLTRSMQRDDSGRPEYFIVLVEDISQRKEAEEALRESEERHRRLVENLKGSHFIYQHDTQGVFQYLSESVTDVLGYTPEEFMTRYDHYLTDHPVNQAVRRHTELSIQGIRQPPYEVNIWHKNGSSRWLEVQEVPVLDATGQVIAVEGVAQDITERKRAEEALRDLTKVLENKVAERTAELRHRARQLQKLTLDMSEAEERERRRMAEILHDDLQQELAAAKFHLSLVRNRIRYDPSLQGITAQIDQMLSDAIGKSRSLSHELSPAVLRHDDFVQTLRWLAEEIQARHGLMVHVYAHGPVRSGSEVLKSFLYRTARELLFNVVKHAGVGEARVRVRQCGRYICLLVSDRGRGFEPQELQEAAGFGLLSIRERIELLSGRMKIKSARGRGSTFVIVVPDGEIVGASLEAETQPGGHAQGAGRPAAGDNSRLRVLLADDHEIVREGLRSLLGEEQDVEVVGEAANGREAVDAASRLKPDVVVMDVSMPMIEGDEATRQIKAYLPQTRVVALSMHDQPEKIEAMYRAGAESYVLKTAPSEELLAAIRGRKSDSQENR